MIFENFLWDKFPQYFDSQDTYKDVPGYVGKGLLQRFLSIFGRELDEELINRLEGLALELDPETASDQFLSELAYMMGNPADILGDINVYRIVLTQAISLYKVKGTSKSYHIFFGIMGMKISLEEVYPLDNIFDNNLLFDTDVIFDINVDELGMTDYNIRYNNLPGQTVAPLTLERQLKIREAITLYLEPINANLNNLTYDVTV